MRAAELFARTALAAGFLSAVADRFGLWGPAGTAGVAWGDFGVFTQYVGTLNFFLPSATWPFLAWAATILEVAAAVWLLTGRALRYAALLSGGLLLSFGLTMAAAIRLKAPLDYSVFAAAAAAFLLARSAASGERSRTRSEKRRGRSAEVHPAVHEQIRA